MNFLTVDDSLATYHSILVLIWITNCIQNFFKQHFYNCGIGRIVGLLLYQLLQWSFVISECFYLVFQKKPDP